MLLLLVIIYLAFISLGLPDAVLGSSWPVMHRDLGSTLEFAGIIALVVSSGTVISSLLSARLIHHFGPGKVVAVSVLMTAVALLGFTQAQSVWILALLAIPLGLGAGSVDAALNNFVAIHYKSKHMNYLHSFWGVGATAGPLIMAAFLSQQEGWRSGYTTLSYVQFALVVVLFLSLPLWKQALTSLQTTDDQPAGLVTNASALKMKGVKLQLVMFCCYCSLEAGAGLWAASYLTEEKGVVPTEAAFWTAMYFLGITAGRFVCGFIADKVKGETLIRSGIITIFIGVILLLMPLSPLFAKIGLILIGFGCAPIYPNTIHLTPQRFGQAASQAIIGLSMAFAYVGTTLFPPIIGAVASTFSFVMFPVILLAFSIMMLMTTEQLKRLASNEEDLVTAEQV
ncbi:MFS transporter [Photobacterium nomapromontoriensis]|uniref:MFS transporter n=1 Tax=Photobacterium nomapromontoriensis TaxID=2910237 RepID=UPI003D0FBDBF